MRAYFNFAALIADKLSEVKGDVRRDGYFACGGNATDCKCHSIRGTIGTVHKLLFGKFQKVTAMTLSAKTLIPTTLTALAAVALPASAADAKPRTFMDMAYGSAAMSGDQVCRETLHDLQLVDHSGDGEANATQTINVTVTDVNEAPEITSIASNATAFVNAAENQTAVVEVVAADAEMDALTYSLTGGVDKDFLTIFL